MKTVKKYLNAFSADVAKGMLENEGIQAEVLHRNMPYLGISYKMAVELIVNDEDYDRALELIKRMESEGGNFTETPDGELEGRE